MKIKTLRIQNFRSVSDLTLELGSLSALIGPNSVGKSNILKAIDLVLGEGWTTKAKVARGLFGDPSKRIIIDVTFQEPIQYVNRAGYQVSVTSVRLTMAIEPELDVKTTINGGQTFYGQDEFKRNCHFIYIPSERNLARELTVSHWSMLGKLMRLVYENYVSSYQGGEQALKDEFSKKIGPAKEFLENDFSGDQVTYKKFVGTFQKYCQENSAGLANEFNPVLNIYNLNWFYKTLQINIKEDYPDRHFDSEEVGAGMQNLLLISIFQTYAELMGGKVIFGLEEPEIYLYPQAQRALYKNLIRLADNTQIIYSTHNPNFVDAGRPQDILSLRKDVQKGTYILQKDPRFSPSEAVKSWHRIYTNFNPERNEVFFARKVLLVEGESDKILFTTLCESKWDIDLDKNGISIIECGGKGGIVYFLGVCKLLGCDEYFAVWDKDGGLDNPSLLEDALTNKKGLELEPDLEGALGLPSGNDSEKVKNAYGWASDTEKTVPDTLEIVRQFLTSNHAIDDQSVRAPIEEEDIPF